MFKLTGPLASSLQGAFVDEWAGSTGEILVGPGMYPVETTLRAPALQRRGFRRRTVHPSHQLAGRRRSLDGVFFPVVDVWRRGSASRSGRRISFRTSRCGARSRTRRGPASTCACCCPGRTSTTTRCGSARRTTIRHCSRPGSGSTSTNRRSRTRRPRSSMADGRSSALRTSIRARVSSTRKMCSGSSIPTLARQLDELFTADLRALQGNQDRRVAPAESVRQAPAGRFPHSRSAVIMAGGRVDES